ncbi:phosphoribosyltransferase family protein [Rhodohalobacter halophilus]|uniref:phosphoribosyltransferase family protein n=1 Tax=Rhodohalobacter halophilus TaxID=1812810 RepID=UPI00083FA947|nr:phosphoribosyltransferase family protein [Rhodohalobacter halophilus]
MILSDHNRIQRTAKRMAYQIIEEAHGADILLVGLNERGFALANLLKQFLDKASEKETKTEQLWAIRDDQPLPSLNGNENTVLVIVDDVIFSGSTLMEALDRVGNRDQFQRIFVTVLVDRGHRKYPIEASVIGIHIPTKLNEQIEVGLKNGIPDSILLTESND